MKRAHHASPRKRQQGLTLIELMLALFVLAVGLAASMMLVTTAIASNNRNKLDTTSTLLSQMVLEKILTPGNANLPPLIGGVQGPPPHFVNVTDCTGANYQIRLDAGGPGLLASGDINFAVNPVPLGYGMNYTVCRAGGQTAIYEVRWNIVNIKATPNSTYMKQVTVAARPLGAGANTSTQLLFYGLPITLRGVSGISPN